MRVKELINRLLACNPDAAVKIEYEIEVGYSDQTWGTEDALSDIKSVNNLDTWVAIVAEKQEL